MYPTQGETSAAGKGDGQDLAHKQQQQQQQQQQRDDGDDQDDDDKADAATRERAAAAANGGLAGGGDFTDLQPVTKFRAHDKYLIRCE